MAQSEVIVHQAMDPRYSRFVQQHLAHGLNGVPSMLVYDFDSAFLGLGSAQSVGDLKPESLADVDRYPIVRRLTTGGASAHAFDSSACFVVLERLRQPKGGAWIPSEESVQRLGTVLQNYVRGLGVNCELFVENRTSNGRTLRSYYVGNEDGRFLAALASGLYAYDSEEGRQRVQVTQGCLRLKPLEDVESPVLAMKDYDEGDVKIFERVLGSVLKSSAKNVPSLDEIASKVAAKYFGKGAAIKNLDLGPIDLSGDWIPKGGIAKIGLCELRSKEKFTVEPI